jgi:hypothetical protein
LGGKAEFVHLGRDRSPSACCAAAPDTGPALRAEFEDSDQLGQGEWREGVPFDAVTCMFAIHYFFVSEQALDTFLHNVVLNLKDGAFPSVNAVTYTHAAVVDLSHPSCACGWL